MADNKDHQRNERSIGSLLKDIESKIEENRSSLENQIDQIKVAVIGDDFHKGLREVVIENEKKIDELDDTGKAVGRAFKRIEKLEKIKKSGTKEKVMFGGGFVAIIEIIEYLKTL